MNDCMLEVILAVRQIEMLFIVIAELMFSVVIPTYNRVDLLARTLDSVSASRLHRFRSCGGG